MDKFYVAQFHLYSNWSVIKITKRKYLFMDSPCNKNLRIINEDIHVGITIEIGTI